MNVSLTPALEKFVDAKVESGRYSSAGEVIREALRLLEEQDRTRGTQVAVLNHEPGQRLAALDLQEDLDKAAGRGRLQRKARERKRP